MTSRSDQPAPQLPGFAGRYLSFIRDTGIPLPLPDDTELLYPYEKEEVLRVMKEFYGRYYSDDRQRIYLIGINPGRFGAGVTGIPFTDPEALRSFCGIEHSLEGGRELSSRFIYDLIDHCGGPGEFYGRCFLTAFSPLGFTCEGKNRNYYDTPILMDHLSDWLVESFRRQIDLGAARGTAFSLGQGKNYKILKQMNEKHRFFKEIRPLPHPRWVMQYRRKREEEFLDLYKSELNKAYEL
jgi:hypothetical protein